jgi:hypothetical protein
MTETEGKMVTYDHTQKGPWGLVMYAMAAAFLTVSWYVQDVPALAITFGVIGAVQVVAE